MPRTEIEGLLRQTIGMDPASIGSPAIERAVQRRLAACGLGDSQTYWEHLRACAAELQELVDEVVVPESWFFRDIEAFVALSRLVREEGLRTGPGAAIRILSLPCSTGEEPYSIAMALLDAGVSPERFHVDAVDVSGRALRHAVLGVYGNNSFRGLDLAFRERHFEAVSGGYRLADSVRQQVHFQWGNMSTPGFLSGAQLYDVIFCRNVLIYFDRVAQLGAGHLLARLLTAPGLLFTGSSEVGVLLNHGFVSAKFPMAFAVRKAVVGERDAPPAAARPAKCSTRLHTTPPCASPPRCAPGVTPVPAAQPRPPNRPPPATLCIDDATRLADQGRLVEAAAICEEHLRRHGPSAAAFHLMGLVRDAAGNQHEACSYYRKALYLDPNHHATLIHLAFFLERQGNAEAAQLLRTRARRVEQESED